MQAMHTTRLPLPAHQVNLMQNGNPGRIISKKRHQYQDHQKGLFPNRQSIPCPQSPPIQTKGCPNSTIKGLSLHLRKPITLAVLEYNSDFGLCSSAIGPPTDGHWCTRADHTT